MSPYRKALDDMLREWDRLDAQRGTPLGTPTLVVVRHKMELLDVLLDKLRDVARKAAAENQGGGT